MTAYGHPGPAPELAEANAHLATERERVTDYATALSITGFFYNRCRKENARLLWTIDALELELKAAWAATGVTQLETDLKLAGERATQLTDELSRAKHETNLMRAERDGARVDLGSVA